MAPTVASPERKKSAAASQGVCASSTSATPVQRGSTLTWRQRAWCGGRGSAGRSETAATTQCCSPWLAPHSAARPPQRHQASVQILKLTTSRKYSSPPTMSKLQGMGARHASKVVHTARQAAEGGCITSTASNSMPDQQHHVTSTTAPAHAACLTGCSWTGTSGWHAPASATAQPRGTQWRSDTLRLLAAAPVCPPRCAAALAS